MKKEKLYVLSRASYGDFDIRYDAPIFVSHSIEVLKQTRDDLRAKRSKKDIDNGVDFDINDDKVELI